MSSARTQPSNVKNPSSSDGLNGSKPSYDGIIGVDRNIILKKFKTYMPQRFEPATGLSQINAVIVDVDEETGKANNIERINMKNLDIR